MITIIPKSVFVHPNEKKNSSYLIDNTQPASQLALLMVML